MKLPLLVCLLLLLSRSTEAQYSDTTQKLALNYLEKSNKQKTAGWILLGGGAGLTGIGLIISSASLVEEIITPHENKHFETGTVLMVIGLAGMAASIPLFISSGKNRKKAADVSLKWEKTTFITPQLAFIKRYPSITVRIRL